MAPKTILNYVPSPHRRWFGRRSVLTALLPLSILIASSSYFGRPYLHQASYLLKQRRAITHQLPADFVAYESDPDAAALLLQKPDYRPWLTPAFDRAGKPHGWQSPAFYHPKFLNELIPTKSDGTLFVHGRQNPAGQPRLVVVHLAQFRQLGDPGINTELVLEIRTRVLIPASWSPGSSLQKLGRPWNHMLSVEMKPKDHLRLYAGQPDPNDATHFTIDYSLAAQQGVIDGYVRPAPPEERAWAGGQAHDEVVLLVRDGPLWGRMDSTPIKGRQAPPR
jgi:hypothetical protein